ncbi:MAG: exodeoxyribonuclease VII large subunit [Chloroflexota bacterium]|nr:exodeoxyribonuclease VII large subunit [Chloroflexota bacterium]PLS78545.1 MAG: exodeoxyribonuclease VII large subunit [Chloroflexota bacterium]
MHIFSISDLTGYIGEMLDADPILSDVWVEGEVSNWSRAASGHCYWTLREGDAQLQTVCWRQQALKQPRLPTNGDQVLVHGRVSFWPVSGKLQLYVDLIRPAGIGLLHAQVEALKQRLESEGLFDPGRKRPIPALPRRIGVVTSPTGAALRDILSVLRERWPLCEVVLAPAVVQGEQAPESIVEALYNLYGVELDVIIVARGGGSIEDLWAFNDEVVVRAVFASPVPVITGVGHETDTTVVDYVADLRAPTPSVAAAYATPNVGELRNELLGLVTVLHTTMTQRLDGARDELEHTRRHIGRLSPHLRLQHDRQLLAQTRARLERNAATTFTLQRLRLDHLRQQLETLNPRATLARGYAVVRGADGTVVLDPATVTDGDTLVLELRDGLLGARAEGAPRKYPNET